MFRLCGINQSPTQLLRHSHGIRQLFLVSRGFRTKRSDDFTGLRPSNASPATSESEKADADSFLNFLRSKTPDSASGQLRAPNPFERTADRTPSRVALGSIFDSDTQSAKRLRRASKEVAPKSPSGSGSSGATEQDERLLRALRTGFELGHEHSKPSGLFGSLSNEKIKRSPIATIVGVTFKIFNTFLNAILFVLGVWLLYSLYKVRICLCASAQ